MKIARRLVAYFVLALSLFSSTLLASEKLIQAIESEQVSLESTYQLIVSDVAERSRLIARYHHALLAAENDLLVLELSSLERTSLQKEGYALYPALDYRAKRQAQLAKNLKQLMSSAIEEGVSHFSIVSEEQSEYLEDRAQSASSVVVNGIPGFECYPTVEETEQLAFALQASYPDLAEIIDIGDSWEKVSSSGAEGYDLWVMKITNKSVVRQKPILFIHSAMHAREYTTASLTLDFAKMLLEDYATNADVEWIVDYHEVHILFHMNPDGRKIAEAGVLKRKNNNTTHCSSTVVTTGVDLNRNFSFFWNAGGFPTSYINASGQECADTYRGPSPASEPETQAVESYLSGLFVDERGRGDSDAAPEDKSGLHLDIHSFGNLVLYPFSHTESPAPNAVALRSLARRLAYFNRYMPQQSPDLYLLDGASDSASYGEMGVAHITYELGSTFFQACSTYNNSIKPDNLNSLLHSAKLAEAPYKLPGGPYIADFRIKGRLHPEITVGTDIPVMALVSDRLFSELNGMEQSHTVSAIEYSVDKHFYENDASSLLINPLLALEDGVFDESEEQLNLTLDNSTGSYPIGRHTVYLRAADSAGNWGAISARHFSVISNSYLEASISADCNFNFCQLDASESIDTDGDIVSYRWDLGDGNSLQGREVIHIYQANGDYTLTLTVEGEDGELNTTQIDYSVNLSGVIPEYNFDVRCNELSCEFDSSESMGVGGSTLTHNWNIGDERYQGALVEYTFPSEGDYLVTGYVVSSDQWLNGQEISITVQLPEPEPQPEQQPQPVQEPSSGGGGSMFWLIVPLLLRAMATCFGNGRRLSLAFQ